MKTSFILAATALLISTALGTAIPDLFPRSDFPVGCTGSNQDTSPDGKCHTVNADNCKIFCKCDKHGSFKCDNKSFGKCSKNDMAKLCSGGYNGWKCYCDP